MAFGTPNPEDDARGWKPSSSYNPVAKKVIVVWRETPTTLNTNDTKVKHIRGAAVEGYHFPPPDNFVLSATTGQENPTNPAISSSTKEAKVMVIWEDDRNKNSTDQDIYGTIYSISVAPPPESITVDAP